MTRAASRKTPAARQERARTPQLCPENRVRLLLRELTLDPSRATNNE
jgi:hypothetical protein